jgi:hypothetical protein
MMQSTKISEYCIDIYPKPFLFHKSNFDPTWKSERHDLALRSNSPAPVILLWRLLLEKNLPELRKVGTWFNVLLEPAPSSWLGLIGPWTSPVKKPR